MSALMASLVLGGIAYSGAYKEFDNYAWAFIVTVTILENDKLVEKLAKK